MKISIIIPVHNGIANLRRVLAGLKASTRQPDEVIVVDDASTEDLALSTQEFRARLLRLESPPHGPAYSRNRGAEIASGDVLFFVDSDVVVHPDTVAKAEVIFVENPDVSAVFGSYDETPPDRSVPSLYKNLLHHYTHQHARLEAVTFWAGCGAIRRSDFLALGGFDETYTRPSIEDIELGFRLRVAGKRIWLQPELQATHLKRWTLPNLLKTDILDRAIPWTRLILRTSNLPSDLNLDNRSRLSAVLSWLVVICLLAGCWLPWLWLGTLAGVGGMAGLNLGLYRFFYSRGGVWFALAASGLHFLYFLYSSAVFAGVTIITRMSDLFIRR